MNKSIIKPKKILPKIIYKHKWCYTNNGKNANCNICKLVYECNEISPGKYNEPEQFGCDRKFLQDLYNNEIENIEETFEKIDINQ